MPEECFLSKTVKYIISFYREGGEKLFTTEVELGRLIGGLQADGGEEAGTRTGMVNLDLTDASGMDLGSWAFPLSYQKTGGSGGRLSLVLDGMMTAGLREAVEAKGAGGGLNYAERNFSTSITRLGEVIGALKEPQDIYAEIVIQPTYEIRDEEYTEYKSGSPVRSNVENTLFAEVLAGMRPGADGGEEMCMEAEIRAFRHLSNIQYGNPQTRTVFTLDDINLDWTSPGVGMYGISGSETQDGYRTVCWEGASRDGADFPSIPLLAEKHSLEGKGAATISNLRLGAGSAPDDGLIDELYTGERKGKYTRYLGLFGRADGFIKGLTLLDDTRYTYDEHHNQILVREKLDDKNWRETSKEYDSMGRCIAEQDALGNRTLKEYEAGRPYPSRIITPKGEETAYSYDIVGRRMSISNTYGTVEMAYNSRNFVTSRTDGEGYTSHKFYDRMGNLTAYYPPERGRL